MDSPVFPQVAAGTKRNVPGDQHRQSLLEILRPLTDQVLVLSNSNHQLNEFETDQSLVIVLDFFSFLNVRRLEQTIEVCLPPVVAEHVSTLGELTDALELCVWESAAAHNFDMAVLQGLEVLLDDALNSH